MTIANAKLIDAIAEAPSPYAYLDAGLAPNGPDQPHPFLKYEGSLSCGVCSLLESAPLHTPPADEGICVSDEEMAEEFEAAKNDPVMLALAANETALLWAAQAAQIKYWDALKRLEGALGFELEMEEIGDLSHYDVQELREWNAEAQAAEDNSAAPLPPAQAQAIKSADRVTTDPPTGPRKRLAVLTPEEDAAWDRLFADAGQDGRHSDEWLSERVWAQLVKEFPRLADFDGATPEPPVADRYFAVILNRRILDTFTYEIDAEEFAIKHPGSVVTTVTIMAAI